ncbi:hypothetical protein UPYG_G00247820 [Umbra pygmaea]|uniref:Ig-like domain-containing protein n=1 Tax=Umbra pygmaea TaxID=75934 RepID=A0ABD0WQN8_UMBPY
MVVLHLEVGRQIAPHYLKTTEEVRHNNQQDSMEHTFLCGLLLLCALIYSGQPQDKARPGLTVSPSWWVNAGNAVTLNCQVNGSTTGWRFFWYRLVPYRAGLPSYLNQDFSPELLADGKVGTGGSFSISPVAVAHRGRYLCRAERDTYTEFSELKFLWVEDQSPAASLTVSPNRVQFFSLESVSLSCEGLGNSTGWKVKRYLRWGEPRVLECPMAGGSVTRPNTCTFTTMDVWSDTGVYWCESGTGKHSNALNITVSSWGVALESPALPVTEGDFVTLRCRYQTMPSDLRAEFHKWTDNGSIIRREGMSKMNIAAASQSDEGWYRCEHPQLGASQGSWLSVRALPPPLPPDRVCSMSWPVLLVILLVLLLCLLVTIVLVVKCRRDRAPPGEGENRGTSELP